MKENDRNIFPQCCFWTVCLFVFSCTLPVAERLYNVTIIFPHSVERSFLPFSFQNEQHSLQISTKFRPDLQFHHFQVNLLNHHRQSWPTLGFLRWQVDRTDLLFFPFSEMIVLLIILLGVQNKMSQNKREKLKNRHFYTTLKRHT